MWVGEQITERGIGNGISLIICLGILVANTYRYGTYFSAVNLDSQEAGQMNFSSCWFFAAVFVFVTIATILIIQGHRRIPLQHARRIVGKGSTGWQFVYPIKN